MMLDAAVLCLASVVRCGLFENFRIEGEWGLIVSKSISAGRGEAMVNER